MRAAFLLVVIVGLFSASQAIDLKELGTQLVGTLVEQGKQALKDAGAKLLSSLLGNFSFGKRDLGLVSDFVQGLTDKFGKLLDHGKKVTGAIFGNAVDKLKQLAGKFQQAIGGVKDASEITDAIDEVVDEHNAMHKRLLGDLLQKGKDLLSGAVQAAKDVLGKLKAKASEVVSGLIQKGADLAIGRRALSDHLQKIGSAISTAVSPFKDIVSGLGDTLKGHFSNLVDTVKGHAAALKDKLSPHIDDLKDHGSKLVEHGKNALGALSEVVKDILQQTLDNAKPHLQGALDTLKDGANTVGNHFTGN